MLRILSRRLATVANGAQPPVTTQILEAGQIADWIIEQIEHTYVSKLDGKCESSSYDMSGNTWKYFKSFSGKIKNESKLAATVEDRNPFIHIDDAGLDDFDTLIISKLLRYKCGSAKLLDINNNPLIGDMGMAHVTRHVLSGDSPVRLRSLFMSGCGLTDLAVDHLIGPLSNPEHCMQILELRKNFITNDGASKLAAVLTESCPLEFSLFLNSNPEIGEEGVVALAKAVIETQGRLKVNLKDSCASLTQEDKADVMRMTKNKIRF